MTAEKDEVIVLTDEEGDEHEFAVIDVIEVEGRDYAILLPYSSEGEDLDAEVSEEIEAEAEKETEAEKEAEAEKKDDDLGLEEVGDEAIILRIDKDDEGDDILVDIEDEEEWQRVADAWDELLDEEMEEDAEGDKAEEEDGKSEKE